MTLLLVLVGGAVGALARYLTDVAVQLRLGALPWGALPLGTLVANVAGSFVLGLLAGLGAGLSDPVHALVATGFCGALTTYSTFGLETATLMRTRAWRDAALNVVATVTVGIGACWFGWFLSS